MFLDLESTNMDLSGSKRFLEASKEVKETLTLIKYSEKGNEMRIRCLLISTKTVVNLVQKLSKERSSKVIDFQ